jgi:REP element-mobilizing transposase RayT
MPFVKVWIHFVWSTKDRGPMLTENIRPAVFQHIRDKKGIFLDFINGYVDHVHCLISLGKGQQIDEIVQLIKGESSHWINKNKMCRGHFSSQDEYFAVSVSENVLPDVRRYIARQEEHHRTRSFDEEYELFFEKSRI